MPLRITEFGGYASGRQQIVPAQPAIRTQLSTAAPAGAASTQTLSSGTRMVQLSVDGTSGGGYYVWFGSSVSTVVASSTNAMYIAANVLTPPYFVNPYMRVTSLST
jgi:hypothetical protein